MEYTETNIQKLARLEKELAEVRKSLQSESNQQPDVFYGQYYHLLGNYYVTTRYEGIYVLVNLTHGTIWSLSGDCQKDFKEELAINGFRFVGVYEDYLKEIGL